MNRENIFKISTKTAGEESSEKPPIRSIEPGLIQKQPILQPRPTLTPRINNNRLKATTVNAKGRFSWKGTDNLLHSAFGWKVRAWQKDGGKWKKVAEDWIQSDGSWKLSFTKKSGTVKFQYVAFNRFFTPLLVRTH